MIGSEHNLQDSGLARTAPIFEKDLSVREVELASVGGLDVRLASDSRAIDAALALRHEVFVAERGLPAHHSARDCDRFDAFCDHLVVYDRHKSAHGAAPVVGTCRVMLPGATSGFYSEAEFDLAPLFAQHRSLRFCEVGRACVAPAYRTQRTLEALWRGLFVYAARHGIEVYFGSASFPGSDPDRHGMALSWLYHNAVSPRWSTAARPDGAAAMSRIPAHAIDSRLALRQMPPLLRGYLRIGAHVAPQAFIDQRFATTDVLVLAPLANAPAVWRRRFESMTGIGAKHHAGPVGIRTDML